MRTELNLFYTRGMRFLIICRQVISDPFEGFSIYLLIVSRAVTSIIVASYLVMKLIKVDSVQRYYFLISEHKILISVFIGETFLYPFISLFLSSF